VRWRNPRRNPIIKGIFTNGSAIREPLYYRLLLMKVLVVEDDRKVAGFIEMGLREEGYAVDVAKDGDEATMLAHVNDYDAMLLDLMLPKKNGLQVAAELRKEGRDTPILMLTARDATDDIVRGLDAGADDYHDHL